MDEVAELADLGRVVLVVDWPAVEGFEVEVVEISADRSSMSGWITTIVGSVVSGAIATIVVGMTATGWITRSRTCDTATQERVSAATAASARRLLDAAATEAHVE